MADINNNGGNVPTNQEVLDCPMDPARNDAKATSVRDYLKKLLTLVWQEGEGFDGKRPFGNSGWEYEVFSALGKAGIIDATFATEGWMDDCDSDTGYALVTAAIASL